MQKIANGGKSVENQPDGQTGGSGSGKAFILEAARQLVIEEGLGALSVRSVAKRANYSPAGLYRHFASIDELRQALTHAVAIDLRDALDVEIDLTDGPSAITRRTLEWAGGQGNLAELLLGTSSRGWPEEIELEWEKYFSFLEGLSDERRFVVNTFAWEAIRAIWRVHTIPAASYFDQELLFNKFLEFLKLQVAEGTL